MPSRCTKEDGPCRRGPPALAPSCDVRACGRREAAAVDGEIRRLTDAVAAGKDVPTEAFNERRAKAAALRAQIEALRARPAPTFDRAAWFAACRTLGGDWAAAPLLNPTSPRLGRQVLRRLGIERVEVRRDGDGWTFEGLADLGRLVGGSVTIGHAGSGVVPPDLD